MKTNREALSRVDVVPYDPMWPFLYEAEEQLLRSALGPVIRLIEQIGSTAIPGLKAKPIIDMMASVADLREPSAFQKLELLGYGLVETGMKNRLLFRKIAEGSGLMFHLHIVGLETWEGRKERIMRDYLLSHPADTVAYGQLKERLAISHADDSLGYTKAKTDFIQQLMDRACEDLGRPRIDVWND